MTRLSCSRGGRERETERDRRVNDDQKQSPITPQKQFEKSQKKRQSQSRDQKASPSSQYQPRQTKESISPDRKTSEYQTRHNSYPRKPQTWPLINPRPRNPCTSTMSTKALADLFAKPSAPPAPGSRKRKRRRTRKGPRWLIGILFDAPRIRVVIQATPPVRSPAVQKHRRLKYTESRFPPYLRPSGSTSVATRSWRRVRTNTIEPHHAHHRMRSHHRRLSWPARIPSTME